MNDLNKKEEEEIFDRFPSIIVATYLKDNLKFKRKSAMSSAEFKKKKRSTTEQLEEFLEFCKRYPEILQRKNRNSEKMEYLFSKLSDKLNTMNGPKRTVKEWKQALFHWKDQVKCRVQRAKLAELNSAQQTKNQKNPHLKPTNLDLKALRVFGLNGEESMANRRSFKIEDQSTSSESGSKNNSESDEVEMPLWEFIWNDMKIKVNVDGRQLICGCKAPSDDTDGKFAIITKDETSRENCISFTITV